ncbi:MAG TPA: phosphoenolpyruvate-utilizing N-terminal domain-containing protein, partial [Candidatus Sulfotelmatobacter sp.]|nr:phosphoenolpyruvate-utilizing N-terminal domain-containing protein [Candidatus Sulfotelmatobacter sp.]
MNEKNVRLAGHAIAQGLAIGQAFLYREKLEALAESYWIEEHQVEEELRRLERAIEVVAQDLRVSAQRIESAATAKLGAIFEAHEVMLQDPALRQEVHKLVTEDLIRAEHALARAFGRREKKFRQMTEAKPRQYADDVADLAQRLLREMAGIKVTSLEKMPPGRVLVARRLLPSDTIALPRRGVAGIVAEFGGPGSHVALLAEALGIPTVAQIPNLLHKVAEEDLLLVDGFRGEVVLNPDTATQARYRQETRGAQARRMELLHAAGQPARTRDGAIITVMANVSCRDDAATAAQNGADGVGLYRLEGFYLARK